MRFGGTAAQQGFVRFVALPPAPPGALSFVEVAIREGRYRVTTGGGLFPGHYRVEVAVQRPTGRKTLTNTGFETVETDEIESISDPDYAGPASPLVFATDGRASATFDIEVPRPAP